MKLSITISTQLTPMSSSQLNLSWTRSLIGGNKCKHWRTEKWLALRHWFVYNCAKKIITVWQQLLHVATTTVFSFWYVILITALDFWNWKWLIISDYWILKKHLHGERNPRRKKSKGNQIGQQRTTYKHILDFRYFRPGPRIVLVFLSKNESQGKKN